MSKGAQLLVGTSVIFALLGWYGYTNLESASTFQYYKNLDELLSTVAASSELDGKPLRVHGYVAAESIERNLEAMQVRFRVQNAPPHRDGATGDTLDVIYASLETPDLFRDGAEVVVEGRLLAMDGSTVFAADNVLAKCPSKFEANAELAQSGDANR